MNDPVYDRCRHAEHSTLRASAIPLRLTESHPDRRLRERLPSTTSSRSAIRTIARVRARLALATIPNHSAKG